MRKATRDRPGRFRTHHRVDHYLPVRLIYRQFSTRSTIFPSQQHRCNMMQLMMRRNNPFFAKLSACQYSIQPSNVSGYDSRVEKRVIEQMTIDNVQLIYYPSTLADCTFLVSPVCCSADQRVKFLNLSRLRNVFIHQFRPYKT